MVVVATVHMFPERITPPPLDNHKFYMANLWPQVAAVLDVVA